MTNDPIEVTLLPWRVVAKALFQQLGITKGLYRLGVNFSFAALNAQPIDKSAGEDALPSALAAITGLGLSVATGPGPMVFDAAQLTLDAPSPRQRKPLQLSKELAEKVRQLTAAAELVKPPPAVESGGKTAEGRPSGLTRRRRVLGS
jgi:hypothetical protein